jgi:hypothetical protein
MVNRRNVAPASFKPSASLHAQSIAFGKKGFEDQEITDRCREGDAYFVLMTVIAVVIMLMTMILVMTTVMMGVYPLASIRGPCPPNRDRPPRQGDRLVQGIQ